MQILHLSRKTLRDLSDRSSFTWTSLWFVDIYTVPLQWNRWIVCEHSTRLILVQAFTLKKKKKEN